MKMFMLGACLSAMFGSAAIAQSHDPYDGGYQDQQAQPRGQSYPDGQNQDQRPADNGYNRGDRGYSDDRDYGRGGNEDYHASANDWQGQPPRDAHYTRRIGTSWQDADGRYCTWRQLTWQDADGNPAYKWVPRCRD